jgi:hypothetical protein
MFLFYILRRLVLFCTLLCIYRATEHTEQQSSRAVCSRAVCRLYDPCSVVRYQPTADYSVCAPGAVVCLGVITIPTITSLTTLPSITTLNDLDRSLLDSSPLESTELQKVTSLVNTIVCSSTLETPVKRYI